jgi:hypothetical protein
MLFIIANEIPKNNKNAIETAQKVFFKVFIKSSPFLLII